MSHRVERAQVAYTLVFCLPHTQPVHSHLPTQLHVGVRGAYSLHKRNAQGQPWAVSGFIQQCCETQGHHHEVKLLKLAQPV